MESLDAREGFVVGVVEGGDDEEDKVHEEAKSLHSLAAVKLVVDEEGGEVVAGKGDADVDEVVEPAFHDGGLVTGDDLDEFGLEELVAVEEDVIRKPSTCGGNHAGTKVSKGEPEGCGVVARNLVFLLGRGELLAGRLHLVGTEINKPEGSDSWNGEGDSISPLDGQLRIRGVSRAVVEDEEQQDEDDLVKELTPSLHQERTCNLATAM